MKNVQEDLKNAIKAGVQLKKASEEEIKAREFQKKKRMEELKRIAEKLEKEEANRDAL